MGVMASSDCARLAGIAATEIICLHTTDSLLSGPEPDLKPRKGTLSHVDYLG